MVHIDYISLSAPDRVLASEQDVLSQFDEMLAYELSALYAIEGGHWGGGRAPFRHSYKVHGATLFFSLSRAGVLLELTGRGCEILRPHLRDILARPRVTRVDIAHDIETVLIPRDVTVNGKLSGFFDTATGETVYMGSMKSDTFTRVYKYKPPNPRAGMLRVEHIYRRAYAQKVADDYSSLGQQGLVNHFSTRTKKQRIEHEALSFEYDRVTYSRGDIKQNGTLTWYKKQVKPAMKKLIKSGLLTIDEVLSDLR